LPLLGILFLPFATLMYVMLSTPGRGLTGMGLVLGRQGILTDITASHPDRRPPG
jgi:hypothetical protein